MQVFLNLLLILISFIAEKYFTTGMTSPAETDDGLVRMVPLSVYPLRDY